MGLSDDDVREILRIIDESDVAELLVETERFKLHVLRGAPGAGASSIPAATPRAGMEETPAPGSAASGRGPAASRGAGEPEHVESDGASNGLVTIESPMLGTFYRAEAPGAAPFVEVGAQVGPDTTVCIVEVMKMMNSVPAGVSGTVAEVIAENGQLVEYGEPLFRVRVETGDAAMSLSADDGD